jgi:hypothetical protein
MRVQEIAISELHLASDTSGDAGLSLSTDDIC